MESISEPLNTDSLQRCKDVSYCYLHASSSRYLDGMAAPTTIEEAVAQALLQPDRLIDKDREVHNRPLKDLLDARDRVAAANAAVKPHFGLRFTQLVPPGGG